MKAVRDVRDDQPTPRHVPVALTQTIELLTPALSRPDAICIDATLGLAGHSAELLTRFETLRLIGIDRDPEALALATERLAPFAGRFTAVHATYDEMTDVCASLGVEHVQGILMDLGLSSLQIDESARGFAYASDAPLDMRMDPTTGTPAAELLRTISDEDLAALLWRYGDERNARRIAAAIVRERERAPITSSARLAAIVAGAIPAPAKRTGGNPAKRTFQALRIAINDELEILRRTMPRALDLLAVGGRIVVLSYHSGEDRIVKRALAAGATSQAPPRLPVEPDFAKPYLRLLTRGAQRSDPQEIAANPRSASVRIRAAERITERRAA